MTWYQTVRLILTTANSQCQRTPYGFRVVPQIYTILHDEIANVDPAEINDNHLYQLSLQREPRERKTASKD